ncbi:UxaA family hydrolase [Mycolicibacterium setense]|jgi:altronate dehydratase large subunit
MSALRGFPRTARQPGARNYVFIVPTVVCSTLLSREIADATGAITVSHQHGCGHIGPDIVQTRDLFAGLATNPNVAHSLIVSLGCETVQGKQVAAELERRGHPARLIGIQNSGGYDAALEAGTSEARILTAATAGARRSEFGVDELIVGVTASRPDPRLPELIRLVNRAGARVVVASDQDLSGVLSQEPASVGVGEPVTAPLSVVRNAGAGAQLLAATASCGAQILVDFPAPDQPPQGFPLAPVLGVASGEGLHTMIADEFDLGPNVGVETILGRAVDVYSGAESKAELRGSSSFAIPRLLRTM